MVVRAQPTITRATPQNRPIVWKWRTMKSRPVGRPLLLQNDNSMVNDRFSGRLPLEMIAGFQRLLPGEGLSDDLGQVVVARPPVQALADALGLGHDRRRVARPARRQAHGKSRPDTRLTTSITSSTE